jgi:hypothetical protein
MNTADKPNQLGHRVDAQKPKHVAAVRAHSQRTDCQLTGDMFGRFALGNERGDGLLPVGQPIKIGRNFGRDSARLCSAAKKCAAAKA